MILFLLAATAIPSMAVVAEAKTVSIASVKQQLPTGQIGSKELLSALDRVNEQSNKLKGMPSENIGPVSLVGVKDVLKEKDAKAFKEALQRNSEGILKLQEILGSNELVKGFLNQNNVTLKDVVAVNLLSGGGLIVFHF